MIKKTEFEMLKFIIRQNNMIGYMIGTKSKKNKEYFFKQFKEIEEDFAKEGRDAE